MLVLCKTFVKKSIEVASVSNVACNSRPFAQSLIGATLNWPYSTDLNVGPRVWRTSAIDMDVRSARLLYCLREAMRSILFIQPVDKWKPALRRRDDLHQWNTFNMCNIDVQALNMRGSTNTKLRLPVFRKSWPKLRPLGEDMVRMPAFIFTAVECWTTSEPHGNHRLKLQCNSFMSPLL